jgi:hypothetical protein
MKERASGPGSTGHIGDASAVELVAELVDEATPAAADGRARDRMRVRCRRRRHAQDLQALIEATHRQRPPPDGGRRRCDHDGCHGTA